MIGIELVRINYRLTVRDCAAFSLYHHLRYPLLWVMFAAIVLWALITNMKVLTRLEIVPMVATVVVFTIFLLAVYWIFLLIIITLTLMTRHAGNTLTDHTLELTEEGVVERTAHTRTETRWAGIPRLGITRRYVFLYFAPQNAHVIPRRALADETSWNSVTAECLRRFRESRRALI